MNESVNVPAVKTCTHCHRELPLEKFSKNRNAKDGYDYICKDCSRAYKIELEERMKTGAPILIRSSKINKLINILDDRFTKAKFMDVAEDVGLGIKSAYTYFNHYLRMGLITHVDGEFYKKNAGALANRYQKQTPATSPNFESSTLSEKDINEIFPPEKSNTGEAKPAKPAEHVKVLYKEKPLKDYDAVQLMAALYKYHGYREGWDKLVQVKIIKTAASQIAVMEQASKLPE